MRSSAVHLCALAAIAVPTLSAPAQWVTDPFVNTPVVQTSGDQDVIKLGVCPDASSWVGWFDFQTGGIQVRVQRLNAHGETTFPAPGLLVSDHPQDTFVVDWDLRSDASGNCMLTFVDTRNGGDFDVYAYLIAPDGTFLWGPDGVAISDNDEFEADPRIIQNTNGDYLVVWPRFDVNPGLYVQRLNAAGEIQLAPGGVRFVGDGTAEPAFVELIPETDGDFLAVWVRDTATFASPRYLDTGRYTADGVPSAAWHVSPITVTNAISVPITHRPRIVPFNLGGAVIAWHDTRDGDFHCYVQRILPTGAYAFVPNGMSVSLEAGRQQLDPALAMDPNTNRITVFYRNTDSLQNIQGINAQQIHPTSAARQFGPNGVNLVPYDNQYDGPPRAVKCLGGVAALVETQPGSSVGNFDGVLKLLRFQGDGTLIDGAPLDICSLLSGKGRLSLAPAPGGAVIAAWTDDRNANVDVYAQRVNSDGTLGIEPCLPDLAVPFGQLDFSDVVAFLIAFSGMDPAADFAPPEGVFDFSDVLAFLLAFSAGCP
ncbi:MAG: GC-type dockerin domain-anchored protein [Phycisphaerales bacterium]